MGDALTRQMIFERAEPAQAYDLFVVHAATDAEFVRGYLLPALNLPLSRVLLVDDLPLGGVIVAEVDRGVTQSRFTVAVLSPAYLADRWAVFGEQLASHLSVDDTRIIPLRLTACDLPLRLNARVSLDFTDGARWDAEAGRLRDLVHAPTPAPEPIACPYPGMRAFGPADVGQFFGRDPEVADLVGRLDRGERMIYVIGPSGSGKSSLVQAGLLPVIDAGSSRLGRTFVTRTLRPGERPAERLAQAIDGDLATPVQAIEAFVARHPPADRALVVIDQLEELFTMAAADERQRFIAAVEALRASTPCCFVLALRADFFGALMDSALWPRQASLSRLEVAPLRGKALAEAISAPAMGVDVYLEARLSDRLVADAADEPGVLPLVQETLRMLWDKRRHRYLGLAAYEALGHGGRGLDVAIALRANTAMNELTDPQQAIARRVLLRLVSFGEGRADTRRQLGFPALRSAADDEAALSHVLQHLVAHRLITVDGDPASETASREALVDLAHEALITGWPEFRRWIDERRANEQRRRRLEGKVGEWIERGRGTASLLDAVELAEAVQWIASDAAHELGHPAELAELVAASRAAFARQRLRRRGLLGGIFVALVGVTAIVAVLAIAARDQANNAGVQTNNARHEANNSKRTLSQLYAELGRQQVLEGHFQEAVPYLLAARQNGLDSPPLRMMFWAASRRLPLIPALEHQGPVVSAAFSPDGTRVVTASAASAARVWDAATGKPITGPLEHQGPVWSAAFSPDGTRVVTASYDKTARVWDAATGKPRHPPPRASGRGGERRVQPRRHPRRHREL